MAKRITEKPRNGGTMTESGFWSFIRSALRQKSRWWIPIRTVKNAAKRDYKGSNKRQKFEYLCSSCNKWFPDKMVQVHHKVECGSLKSAEDLPGFVTRLFSENLDDYACVCKPCHKLEHKKEKEDAD